MVKGLPDFQTLAGDPPMAAPYGEPGAHVVMPDGLAVATRPDGRPDLALELVRGTDPSAPPEPYAVLELRLVATTRLSEALARAREADPSATVARAPFEGGSLRLRGIGTTETPADLETAARIVWSGLEDARWVLRLSVLGGAAFKQALLDEAYALVAQARLAVLGVSPRLPLRVRAPRANLVAALGPLAGPDGLVERDAVAGLMRGDPRGLPVSFEGDARSQDRETLAQALADVALDWVAREEPATPGLWRLAEETGAPGELEADLSEPRTSRRPLVMELDPIQAARDAIAASGVDAIVTETVVPALALGMYSLSTWADLPQPRVGALGLGLTVIAPPNPPARPQAVTASIELAPPSDAGGTTFQIGPGEALAYRWSTYAVTRPGRRVRQLRSSEKDGTGERLQLHEDDFPVRFVTVSASSGLLELAAVSGVCRWTFEGGPGELAFALDAERPVTSLTVPRSALDASIDVTAKEAGHGRTLSLTALPAEDLAIDLHLFPGYGPHAVDVTCSFPDGLADVALDFVPEDRVDSTSDVKLVHLTRQAPTATWRWIARSPFEPGYRFRAHPLSDGSTPPWSEVQSPFEPLAIPGEVVL